MWRSVISWYRGIVCIDKGLTYIKYTATAIPFIYSFSGNCAASASNFDIHVSVGDFIFPGSVHIFPQNRQTHRGNIYNSLTDTWMWKLGLRPRYSFSGNICFKFSAFCLCSVQYSNGSAPVGAGEKRRRGSLTMELDLQSLFGLHVHSCTHWVRPRVTPPRIWAHIRGRRQGRRHLFLTPCLWSTVGHVSSPGPI